MVPSEEEIRAAIAEQAGEWFVANQGGPLAEADNAAFLAWLKASPIHLQEYLGVTRAVHHLKAAARDPGVPLESFLAQTRRARNGVVQIESARPPREELRSRLVTGWVGALAASLAALILLSTGVLWWMHDGELLRIPKTYQTTYGEQSTRRLPDGSLVFLDTNSAVTVRYSGRERLLEVNRGQALFHVTPDKRRFRVSAGFAGAITVGAQFDVYRAPTATTVTVADGEVAVFAGEPSWLQTDNGAPPTVQRVKAGYQTRVDAATLASGSLQVTDAKSLVRGDNPTRFNRVGVRELPKGR